MGNLISGVAAYTYSILILIFIYIEHLLHIEPPFDSWIVYSGLAICIVSGLYFSYKSTQSIRDEIVLRKLTSEDALKYVLHTKCK